MVIILEGPDGTGKSTLGKYIAAAMKGNYLHFSKPETEDASKEQLAWYEKCILSNDLYVIDRCWISDIIYGQVMRDREFITPVEEHERLLALMEGRGYIIFCISSIQDMTERLHKRGEDYVTEFSDLLKIRTAYIDLMSNLDAVPVLTFEI